MSSSGVTMNALLQVAGFAGAGVLGAAACKFAMRPARKEFAPTFAPAKEVLSSPLCGYPAHSIKVEPQQGSEGAPFLHQAPSKAWLAEASCAEVTVPVAQMPPLPDGSMMKPLPGMFGRPFPDPYYFLKGQRSVWGTGPWANKVPRVSPVPRPGEKSYSCW
jgi:hypothetical protein